MSRKVSFVPTSIFTDISMGASATSEWIDIRAMDSCTFQIVWTGTPVGSFTVELSQDALNYATITLNPTITASGAGDTAIIELFDIGTCYLRLKYTRTSGTGTVNATIAAKDR